MKLTKPTTEGDTRDHIKSVTLEPMTHIESLPLVRMLLQPLREYIRTVIHECLVMHQ